MTAAWMLSSTIVATLLAGAALALGRVGALYRGVALRWTWVVAMVASLGFALLWMRPAPPAFGSSSTIAARGAVAPAGTRTQSAGAPPTSAPAASVPTVASQLERATRVELPRIPPVIERSMFGLWIVASLVLLALLAVATARLHVERASWTRQDVAGMHVLVSPEFGPAIVGVLHPEIVVPAWVLTLDAASQRAIVAHEEEHRAAHDPALLLAGLAALVVMPWNIGLWMSWRGMRHAIELDCDARVLERGVDGGEYARVLLGAWKSARGRWLPSTAFAERASGLGARVEHLMRPEPRRRAMRTAIGTLVTVGLVAMACVTPPPRAAAQAVAGPYPLVVIDGVKRPDIPPRFRFEGPVVAETLTTPIYRVVYRGRMVEDTTTRLLYPTEKDSAMIQTLWSPVSVAHFGDQARYGAELYYTKRYRDAGGAIIAPGEGNMMVRAASNQNAPAVDVAPQIYNNLFNGITLPADARSQAMAIISAEYTEQRTLHGPMLLIWPRRIELHTARDADLRGLLSTDADRARFDVRSREGNMPSVTADMVAQNMYTNLFQAPGTSAATKTRALAIITASINDDLVAYRRNPTDLEARLALRNKRDAELRPLLSEADRVRFDKIAARTRDAEIKP